MKSVNLINLFNSDVVVQLIVVRVSCHYRIIGIFYGLLLISILIALVSRRGGLSLFDRFIRVIGVR